jgi:hypothetical protein
MDKITMVFRLNKAGFLSLETSTKAITLKIGSYKVLQQKEQEKLHLMTMVIVQL